MYVMTKRFIFLFQLGGLHYIVTGFIFAVFCIYLLDSLHGVLKPDPDGLSISGSMWIRIRNTGLFINLFKSYYFS